MLRSLPFVLSALVMLTLWPTRGRSQAAEWLPRVVVEAQQDTFRVGEPVVIEVALVNETDRPRIYLPIDLHRLGIRVTAPSGEPRDTYPAFRDNMGGPWLITNGMGVPPGGSAREDILLSYYYDLLDPGTYRVEITYPIEGLQPYPADTSRRIEVKVGELVGTTFFSVRMPENAADNQRAKAFAEAVRSTMDMWHGDVVFTPPDSTALGTTSAIAEDTASYLAEPAHFYALRFYDILGSFENDEWNERQQRLGKSFSERYPASAFIESAVMMSVNAWDRLKPTLPDEYLSWPGIDGLCGGTRFRVVSSSDVPTTSTLRYVAFDSHETGAIVLDIDDDRAVECALETAHPGQAVHLFLNGDLVSAAKANPSTCTEAHRALPLCPTS